MCGGGYAPPKTILLNFGATPLPRSDFTGERDEPIKGAARFNEFGTTAGRSRRLTSDGEADTSELSISLEQRIREK